MGPATQVRRGSGEGGLVRTGKNLFLGFSVFVVLCVVLGAVLKAGDTGTICGALFGTPLAIHVFNRLAPKPPESPAHSLQQISE